MSEKIILTQQQRELRAIDFLFDNDVCLEKIEARFQKRQVQISKEKAMCRDVNWSQDGFYFLHVHHSKPFTTLHIEEPNGSIVELYKEKGEGSNDLIGAIQAGVADAPMNKKLLVVCGLKYIVDDVNDLLATKANGWKRPRTKTSPSNLIFWTILADTIEEKNLTLRAGKTKADVLQIADKNAPEGHELLGGVSVA